MRFFDGEKPREPSAHGSYPQVEGRRLAVSSSGDRLPDMPISRTARQLIFGLIALTMLTHAGPAVATPAQKLLPRFDLPLGSMDKVSKEFKKPAHNWLPGHRGVDISAIEGELVGASAIGLVVFAGKVAGKGVVSIKHGSITTTYEPIAPSVQAGDRVSRGQVIGKISTGTSHCALPKVRCLHWGAKVNGEYINPLALLNPKVRLLPTRADGLAGRRS
jgi:murein DD-endopeptidase MepM/ murein hydrolase activator NlpD